MSSLGATSSPNGRLTAARSATASLSSLFCEKNAVTHYPVKGVKRPKAETGKGKTPALGDHQARDLGKLTHAIAEAGRGSSMRPSLILWPSKAAKIGPSKNALARFCYAIAL
jgi:hypothetical protein